MTTSGAPDRYEAMRRLLHIGTFEPGASLADQITMGFVERALWSLPADQLHAPGAISAVIEKDFGLHFEPAEIRHVLTLARKDRSRGIVRSDRRDSMYGLTPERRRALEVAIDEAAQLEKRVMDDWRSTLHDEDPLLSDPQLSRLLADLREFNRQVLLRYGAQAQMLLTGGPPPSDGHQPPAIDDILSALPPIDHHLVGARREVLGAFWSEAEGERAVYLSRLLDNACIVHTAHIDPKCSSLVRGVFQGTLFYLDTNVVYRLLNLQGPEHFFQIRTLLEVIAQIGARPVVSLRTLTELRTSLRANIERIRAHPIASRTLAGLAARASSEQDFVSLYYDQYARTGISVDEFAARARNADALLDQLGVSVDREPHDDIMAMPALSQEEGALLLVARDPGVRLEVITHDAFHRLLILKLRGDTPSFARARAWFLTCDGKLGRYDRMRRRQDGSEIPFCIHPDHCMQMTRWALPRTADYDRAFVQLVACPFVGTIARLPSEAAQRVCARIERYAQEAGIDESLAAQAAILTMVDERLAASLRTPASEAARDRDIDKAIARSLTLLQQRTSAAKRAQELAEHEYLRLRRHTRVRDLQLQELQSELTQERQKRQTGEATQQELGMEKVNLETMLSESKGAEARHAQRADQAELRLHRLLGVARWAAWLVVSSAIVVGYLLLPWAHWPRWARSLYEVGGALSCALALALPLGFVRVVFWIVSVVTVAACVISYLQWRR